MNLINKILKIILFIFLISSIVVIAYFMFVPIDDLHLYNVPVWLNIILFLVLMSIVLLMTMYIHRKHQHFSLCFGLVVALVFLFISLYSVTNAYIGYHSLIQICDTSLMTESYNTENRDFLPYYDLFYQIGEEDAFYSFSVDKIKQCEYVRINNKPYTMKPNSTSYTAERYKIDNVFLKLKHKSDLSLKLARSGYILESIHDTDKGKIKIYSNGIGYFAISDSPNYLINIELLYSYGTVSLEDFARMVVEQSEILRNAQDAENWITDKG